MLDLQERVLARESLRVANALEIVRTARAKLAGGSALSIEDLTTLTKETTMTSKANDDDMKAIFDPLAQKHFTSEENAMLRQRSFDQAEVGRNWESLIAEARALMAKGDPYSPAAQDLARRWQAQVRLFTQGDPEVDRKVLGMWKDAMANPETAPKLPLNPEISPSCRRRRRSCRDSPSPCGEVILPHDSQSRHRRAARHHAPPARSGRRLPVGHRADLRDHRALHDRGSL